jgi:hypothetical protein
MVICGAGLSLLFAFIAVYVQFPVYTAVKANYALGLVPGLACLMVMGLEPVLGSRFGRSALLVFLGLSCACNMAAYCAWL